MKNFQAFFTLGCFLLSDFLEQTPTGQDPGYNTGLLYR